MQYFEVDQEDLAAIAKKRKLWRKNMILDSRRNKFLLSRHTYDFLKSRLTEDNLNLEALAAKKSLGPEETQRLMKRIHISIESSLQDPIPENLMEEIKLLAMANPSYIMEYRGRNLAAIAKGAHSLYPASFINPAEMKEFNIDIIDGRRMYQFSTYPNTEASKPGSRQALTDRFENLAEWFADPEAKIVLSLGSGGMRMFSIPTILKIIDGLGLRDRISEIWGSSGGAIIGTLYAKGASSAHLEQMGHDFYNGRYDSPLLQSKSKMLWQMAKYVYDQRARLADFSKGLLQIYQVYEKAYLALSQNQQHVSKKIPFFSIATDARKGTMKVLTEEANITEATKQILTACDPIKAMYASSSIPFLFPIRLSTDSDENWIDGAFSEEVPFYFPAHKHFLEMQNNPNYPYKRLKLFYVDLGVQLSEVPIFDFFYKNAARFESFTLLGKVLDQTLYSRKEIARQYYSMIPNVEMLGVKFKMNKLGMIDSYLIPRIIQKGRVVYLKQLDQIEKELAARPDQQVKKAS